MGTRVRDIDGSRSIMIDANNKHEPGSCFIIGPQGLRMEFDREAVRQALIEEFGLAASASAPLHAVA